MPSVKTKFAVGVFVLIGCGLALLAVFWLGMSTFLEKGQNYVAYFDESVQGLDRDSPVKYRGVSIGRVESLGVAPDATLIQAVLKIDPNVDLSQDLVAQLKSVGITGIMFIELDRKKPFEVISSPEITFESNYPVIATKPSEIRQFIVSINDVLTQMKALDLKGISDKAKQTLDGVNQAVEDVHMDELSAGLRSAVDRFDNAMKAFDGASDAIAAFSRDADQAFVNLSASIQTLAGELGDTIAHIDGIADQVRVILSQNQGSIAESMQHLNSSMKETESLVAAATDLLTRTDQRLNDLQRPLLITLETIEQASRNLNRALEQVADQPSRLLLGAPRPARAIEVDDIEEP